MRLRAGAGPEAGRLAVAWGAALGLGALAFALAEYAALRLPAPAPLGELAYYPSGRYVEPATFGQRESAADLAWLRAIQYYGERRRTDNRFDQIFHVFDILTTLSPRFESAYVFGAFCLAQEGADFPAAERLMRKGLDENPGSAHLAFQLGFLYYVRPGGRDLVHAAEYFEQAARLPGGPPEAARFAAYARQNAGDLRVAAQLWQRVRDTSPNHYLRELAERELADVRLAMATGQAGLARRRVTTPVVLLGPAAPAGSGQGATDREK